MFPCLASLKAKLWASVLSFWSSVNGGTLWRSRLLLCAKRICWRNLASSVPSAGNIKNHHYELHLIYFILLMNAFVSHISQQNMGYSSYFRDNLLRPYCSYSFWEIITYSRTFSVGSFSVHRLEGYLASKVSIISIYEIQTQALHWRGQLSNQTLGSAANLATNTDSPIRTER